MLALVAPLWANASASAGTGHISGHVQDSAHSALEGICVSAAGSTFGSARTNTNGDYDIGGLARGSYQVAFASCTGGAYAQQWYDGESSSRRADLVSVTEPSTTSGIDATMQLAGHISGHVQDGSRAPLEGICVSAMRSDGVSPGGFARTNTNGDYDIGGLASGHFKVSFGSCSGGSYALQWYDGKSDFSIADPVPVIAPATTSGIDATMRPPGAISGHVEDDTHSALQGICVTATLVGGTGPGGSATTDTQGDYRIAGLSSGSYNVRFGCAAYPTSSYAVQWWNAKPTTFSAGSVSVLGPDTTTGIDATLTAPGAMAGHVEDALTHGPIADVCVGAFVPSDTVLGHFVNFAVTNSQGDYVIRGLLAGAYVVGFESCPWASHHYVPQWFDGKAAGPPTDLVTVEPGATRTGVGAAMSGSSTSGPAPGGETPATGLEAAPDSSAPHSDSSTSTTKPGAPPAAPQCFVPKLNGKKLAAAKRGLKAAHCAVGKVTRRRAPARMRGRVISSKPRAGTRRPAGTKVALVVGSGD